MAAGERGLQKVLSSLRDPNVGRIVLYGMGGTGKTWMAKQVMDEALQHQLFDVTVWVSLSTYNSSLRQAQRKVAERLSISIEKVSSGEEESVSEVGRKIHEFLAERKFLLALDDVWFKEDNALDLMGVPQPNYQNGSKVLITTRSNRVLAVMEPDVLIEQGGLPSQESWSLFCEKAGKAIDSHVHPLAQEVIDKCYGVPLAIMLMGGALKDASDALALENLLKSSTLALGPEKTTYHTMYRAVKFGYNMLPTDVVKECFLYCILFPQDRGVNVKELIRYWVLEGFINELDLSEAAYDKGCAILTEIVNRCLLYREDDDHVTIHNVVREMALDYGRDDGKIFGRAGLELTRPPAEHVWGNYDKISLMDSCIEALPESPRCHKLSTLLLKGNRLLRTIPNAIFLHMQRLRILDLSHTLIRWLPSSLSELVVLHVLLLRGCEYLEELLYINTLETLEVLDLSGSTALRLGCDSFMGMHRLQVLNLSETQIEDLPFLMNLHGLRHLLLSGCRCLKSVLHLEVLTMLEFLDLSGTVLVDFPYGISKLTQVKGLHLVGTKYTRIQWEVLQWLPAGLNWDQSSGSDITTEPAGNDGRAFITVSNADVFLSLDKDSPLWENCFQKFHFSVCPTEDRSVGNDVHFQRKKFAFRDTYFQTRHFAHSVDHNCYLAICSVDSYPHGIVGVLNHAELVSLNNCIFMKRLSDLGLENMKLMRECWIERCDQMDCILNGEEIELMAAIGSLENLWINNLANLNFLCGNIDKLMSFGCLKHLHLDCCPNLISAFSSTLHLENLETLQIKFCNRLESIFGDLVFGEVAMPKLHTLRLWELPDLKSICEGFLPALRNLKVKGCPELKKIPVSVNDMAGLVVIRGEPLWWDNLVWSDYRIKFHLLFRKWGRF